MIGIKVIAFGQIAEITGNELFIEARDTGVLKDALLLRFPALAEKKYAIAVNNRLITEQHYKLNENDVVALMPPYSGG